MNKKHLALLVAAFLAAAIFPQARTTPPDASSAAQRGEQLSEATSRNDEAVERLQLAISSIDYPVTPGDIYQLSYRESAGAIVTRQFQVDGISILDLGVFGKIYALNMPFYQLKQNVENLISRNYTYSTPTLSIISPGVFRVAVKDGTSRVQYITAWGLSRISEIVTEADTPNSSIRDVERISREGKSERFDLLKTTSTSLEGINPFVRPGDTLVLHRSERTVELMGEIRRPGRYELIAREGLKELLEIFGDGFTRKADLDRLQIIRATESGERIEYFSLAEAYEKNTVLNDGDTIVVGDKTARRALIWFEGAVQAPVAERDARTAADTGRADATIASTANGRFSHAISEGIRLSDVLQEIREQILPSADLGAVLLTQPGVEESLVIDIRSLLSGSNLSNDIVLLPNSTIFIPLLRSSVSVAGAVITPGFVPYLPGAPAHYYISLCGGFDPERNSGGAHSVYDQFGRKRPRGQTIMPGDSIFVTNNSIGYSLERTMTIYVPVITTLITMITFGISIGLIDVGQ